MIQSKILLILFVLASWTVQAADTLSVTAPVENVTVFLFGSELKHKTNVKLKAGETELFFTDLSPYLISQSMNVNLDNNIKIRSISMGTGSSYYFKHRKRLKTLTDSVQILDDELVKLRRTIDIYKQEYNLLIANNARIGGKDIVAVPDLQAAADFYRKRLEEIMNKELPLQKKLTETEKYYNQLVNELNRFRSQPNTAFIRVLVSTDKAVDTEANVSYFVGNASWLPHYNFRATKVGDPIKFEYKGKIINQTGLDWDNVKIRLSTTDPSQSIAFPTLSAWYLEFLQPINYQLKSKSNMYQQQQNVYMSEDDAGGVMMESNAANSASINRTTTTSSAEIAVNEVNVEFEIKELYSIPSDGKEYYVDINEYSLKADYTYIAVPKIDTDAFLLASITGWESLNLLDGDANVYFNNTYVGLTSIDTRAANDTLLVSLGRDKKVIISRTKLKDFNSRSLLGNSQKDTYTYEISIRNTNDIPVKIEIQDQIPLASSSEIEVVLLESSKADYSITTGQLEWKLEIKPTETQKLKLSYSVKYPKGKKLNMQKKKVVRQYY